MSTTLTSIRIREIDEEQLPLTLLQQALLEADAKILNEDDVHEFQEQKLEKARRERYQVLHGAGWLMAAGLVFTAACFFSALYLLVKGHILSSILLSVVAGPTGILFMGRIYKCVPPHPRFVEWRSYRIGACCNGGMDLVVSFKAPGVAESTIIPEQARKIARRLANTGVTALFEVEQLDDDPFLIVNGLGERYYLFAWDEEGYIPK